MAGVTLEHVVKRFGDVVAVNDVSIEIEDKEFLVLVGPSGCGKSTILRLIAGLEELTDGNIYIGQRLVNDVAPKDRDIAMVFQNYALYPHMSVYDNLAFALKLRRTPKQEIARRVREAAEILGIEMLLNRKPKQLSGGQRQRVALGRAIVREPQVFLMDEPLSNLDAKLRVQTRAELIKLHRRLQTTVVYVTHDQVEAMTMGSRIAILRDGVLQQLDTPTEVYANPANIFVAGFIGSPAMNFFEAQLEGADGDLTVKAAGIDLRLPPEVASRAKAHGSRHVVLGVRPEHIYDARRAPANGNQPANVKVDVVEHMGNETYVYLTAGETSFTARMDASLQAQPGDNLPVVIDSHKIHLFDPSTERAIV
jgi:multiple sugar transport system ATP-binding protein